MPTLAEMFIGNIQQQNSDMGKTTSDSGAQIGAQLAQMKQQREEHAQQLQMEMKKLQTAKVEKLYGFIADAKNYTNASDRNNYLKSAIGMRNALGLNQEILSDDQIKAFSSDERLGRLSTLYGSVERGELKLDEAAGIANDEQRFAQVMPQPLGGIRTDKTDLNEAQSKFLQRQSQERAAGTRSSPLGERTVNQEHENALNRVGDKDTTLKNLLTTYQNLQNAKTNFEHGGGTPQEFHELQQAVRSNLGLKGTGGVEERAKTLAESTGTRTAEWIQFFSNETTDMNKFSPALVNQVMKMVNIEMSNKGKQATKLQDANASAYRSFYEKHPDLKSDFETARKGFIRQFGVVHIEDAPPDMLKAYLVKHPKGKDADTARKRLKELGQ